MNYSYKGMLWSIPNYSGLGKLVLLVLPLTSTLIIKCILFSLFSVLLFETSLASGDHGHHGNDSTVFISESIASKAGVTTKKVSAGLISEQLKIYGKAVNDPSQVSHIRARFEGTVMSVAVNIGDEVNSGDVLAQVESNESLKKYPIRALMSGVVVARHANPGEIALDQVLFTLANFDKIWVELQVFPDQLNQIKAGQSVYLSGSESMAHSTIEHIIPSQDEKPYSLARVLINNGSRDWTTGLLVSGQVIVNQFESMMVIDNKAIQSVDNQSVVFVKNGNEYILTPLKLGRSDRQFTEVLSGLKNGDTYVVDNSYLIKADYEKSGASHHH